MGKVVKFMAKMPFLLGFSIILTYTNLFSYSLQLQITLCGRQPTAI